MKKSPDKFQRDPKGRYEKFCSILFADRREHLRSLDVGNVESQSDDNRERLALALHYASEIRQFEIERLWQRSLFFWGPLIVAFGGYATLFEKHPRVAFAAAAFGLVGSVAWTLQNRGSKYWQEAWEQKVEALQLHVLGMYLYSNPEIAKGHGWFGGRRYSPSRLAILLSDFTTVAFGGFAIAAFDATNLKLFRPGEPDWFVLAAAIGAFFFSCCLLVAGRSAAIEEQPQLEPDDRLP